MMPMYTYTLIDPKTGNLAFKVVTLDQHPPFDAVQRLNYYTVILITEGNGRLKADFAHHDFSGNSLLCFSPFQPFMLDVAECKGFVLNFHPDFFCILKHHRQVACEGVLFNNIYQPPLHLLADHDAGKLATIIADMREELQQEALAQQDLLTSLLKIFLINASRSKAAQTEGTVLQNSAAEGPFVLQKLKDAIEAHYRREHAASAYADMLNIAPKSLAKITKSYFNKTMTEMIADRIIIEAKRELYLTSKPVKTIAYELGFNDEYHFSRFFKNKATVSPQLYRNQVGFARAVS